MAEEKEILNESGRTPEQQETAPQAGEEATDNRGEAADNQAYSAGGEAETAEASDGQQGGADVEENADRDAEESTQADEEQPEAAGEKKDDKGESGRLFKGKEKKDKKDKSKERISELEDRVKRQMAEFENFRKRSEKEKAQMFEVGAKSVIEKILPVVDNFERGLDSVPEDENSKAFVDGMKMIYKQLMTELESIGVTPIEAVGQEFNPEFHNAVMQVESEEYESGVIAQELQKGYMYRDSVVRHSMVAVVQ